MQENYLGITLTIATMYPPLLTYQHILYENNTPS